MNSNQPYSSDNTQLWYVCVFRSNLIPDATWVTSNVFKTQEKLIEFVHKNSKDTTIKILPFNSLDNEKYSL